jgi:hypothetical protein
MNDSMTARISRSPKYQKLKRTRSRYGWALSILMLIVFYGYICLIAFDKPFLSRPIGSGVMSIGIPLGLAVIVFSVAITGLYVRRANGEFDRLTQEIIRESQEEGAK